MSKPSEDPKGPPPPPPSPSPPRRRRDTGEILRDFSGRVGRFTRDFTAGLDRRELGRLFEEDAARAYSVLAGRDAPEPRPDEDDLVRFLRGAKAFFLGLILKLSPGRRVLFTVSLLCPLLALVDGWSLSGTIGALHLSIDFEPFWFVVSISGLTLLLALELADRLRVRDELEVARALQQALLPDAPPELPGYRLAASSRTANEIGGDYYDLLPLPDGRWAVAVADASGHGISAGLLMAISHATLQTAVDLDPSPEAVLRLLNRTLARTGGRRAFVTLFYGVLDPESGTFDYACAGHPFPYLRRADGTVEELGEGAFPLGVRAANAYAAHRIVLGPGDLLVLYTDGLPEAVSDDDEAYGFPRLAAQLRGPGDPRALHDRLLKDVDRHLGHRSLEDDLTLLVLLRVAPLPLP